MACWTPAWLAAPKLCFCMTTLPSSAPYVRPAIQCVYRGAAEPALMVELGLQGVSNKASTCQTCGQKLADCTGHFGAHCIHF